MTVRQRHSEATSFMTVSTNNSHKQKREDEGTLPGVGSLVPSFRDIYGGEALIERLTALIEAGKVPHALLLSGKAGSEALPLALATAKRILCQSPGPDGDSCGHCLSCRQAATLDNPNLALIFPIAKEGDGKEVISAMQMPLFRDMMRKYPRFTSHEWKELQNSGNKQLSIMVAEAENLIARTSLKSFDSSNQVIVVWLPETMRSDAANKLLKLFEEPPEGIQFILVSNSPESLLPTILSRFQKVRVPPIPEQTLLEALTRDFGISPKEASEAAHLSRGNLYVALRMCGALGEKAQEDRVFEEAVSVFECAASRNPKAFLTKAEALSKESRPFVLEVTERILEVMREAGAISRERSEESPAGSSFVYTPDAYKGRIARIGAVLPFSAFPSLMQEIGTALNELRQNANIKILYFDLIIRISRSLRLR